MYCSHYTHFITCSVFYDVAVCILHELSQMRHTHTHTLCDLSPGEIPAEVHLILQIAFS